MPFEDDTEPSSSTDSDLSSATAFVGEEHAEATALSTREQLLAAALEELDHVGPTQLRLKRVSDRVGVSMSVISKYFDNREGLIAAALGRRYTTCVAILGDTFLTILEEGVDDPELLDHLVDQFVAEETDDVVASARVEMLGILSLARQNPAAQEQIIQLRLETLEHLVEAATKLEEAGRLADGVTALMFLRILTGLLYRHFMWEDVGDVYIPPVEDRAVGLRLSIGSLLRPTAPSKKRSSAN